MIITRTPFRITFFGGGTDYADYFLVNGGATLGATIDKFGYVLVRRLTKLDPFRFKLVYSRSELCHSQEEIVHPVIREVVSSRKLDRLEVHYFADLPNYSGLGTSSAFTVGLLNAIDTLYGEQRTASELAHEAVSIERIRLNEMGGLQDQYTCAHGGLIKLNYEKNGDVEASWPHVPSARMFELRRNLMLFFTGITRDGTKVVAEQVGNLKNGGLGEYLEEMKSFVDEGVSILTGDRDLSEFGLLLDKSWELKKQLASTITNTEIDSMYSAAKQAGAIGGKILGAGAGGFMLLFVPEEHQSRVRKVLKSFNQVPFDFSRRGTEVMNMSPA